MKPVVLICLMFSICASARAADPEVKSEDLPRIQPTEPADALRTFQVRKGFRIELVAAEPLVVDPIAMCFDENGRLFVVEMRDYSERRAEKLGRIRMLEDKDGDGKFDTSKIFLDRLPWPTAVFCYGGGVLVGACPDIIFAKDTSGDGVADETKTLFTGFGGTQEKLNVQALFNNFIWGIDNRIHGCSGHQGGMVTQAMHPDVPPLDVRNKGFVIDPRDWSVTTENGGGQYGLSFDPWGRLFTCSNSSHIETFMYDARYAARNRFCASMPDPRMMIAIDGPAAEVFRISPEEPWRMMRTRWRVAGLLPGPIEGGGRSAGYFTGATGITIYKGNAFNPDYVGDAFIGDAGGNLVHHKRIRRASDGLALIAERPPDEKTIEFCASTDTWFRPVDFANAPDGCLYIADMYREVIEHPWSIPESIKKHLDLNSGNDRGRIYRITPDGLTQPKPVRLGGATTAQLVEMLEHSNGWHRETASRLLFERQDPTAIPRLKDVLATSDSPLARVHALHMLDGLGGLTEPAVIQAMSDTDPQVRCHAIALAEHLLVDRKASDALWTRLGALADDPEIAVRYQLAFTLGQIDRPDRNVTLCRIAKRDITSNWMRTAVLSSLASGAGGTFSSLSHDAEVCGSDPGRQFLRQLAEIIGASERRADLAIVEQFLNESHTDTTLALMVTHGLAEGADRAGALKSIREAISPTLDRAAEIARDPNADPALRRAAIPLLSYLDYQAARPVLLSLLLRHNPQSIQLAALSVLDRFASQDVADDLLGCMPALHPRARTDALSMLVNSPDRATRLLRAIAASRLQQVDLDATQVNQLLNNKNAEVRKLARATFSAPTTQRTALLDQMRPALSLEGDFAHGRALFQQRCISCHRAEGEGFGVGPDLVSVRNAGAEKLLTGILDPSRETSANYVAYLVETTDGQSILGMISSDTPSTITLRQAYGRETILARSKIKRMTSQGKSLMPDGLEAGLGPQDLADLIEFVSKASSEKPATP